MSRISTALSWFLAFIPGILFSQVGQSSMTFVKGNCGMCQYRIESTAISVDGVDTAVWSPYSDSLKVWYQLDVKLEQVQLEVHRLIAEAGHDNSFFRAPDSSYDKLHKCCKYDRLDYPKYSCIHHDHVRSSRKVECTVCGLRLTKRRK